jgi:O-antigen/teichoic acid export membrane protein
MKNPPKSVDGGVAVATERWRPWPSPSAPADRELARKLPPVLYSAAGQMVVALASVVGIRVYTGLLSRGGFGFAMMAMGAVALLDGVIVAALSQTLLSVCAQIDDKERQRQVAVGLAFRLFRAMAIALTPLAALGIAAAAAFPDATPALAPGIALVYLAEEIAKTSMVSPLIARRDYPRFSLWSATEAVVALALTGLSLALARADWLGFLLGLIVARVLTTCAFFLAFFGGRYFHAIDLALAAPHVRAAVRYGAPVSAMAPIGWIGAYLDRYVIGATGGSASAGVYAAVAGLVGRPYAVTTAVLTNYFRPALFRERTTRAGMVERRRVEWRWIAVAATIGLFGAAGVGVFGGMASSLALARDYRDGAPAIMIVLSLSQTFTIMTHAADNAALSAGASARLLRIQVVLVVFALVAVPLGALRFGALGAAVGRLMSEAMKFGATLILSERLLGGPALAERGAGGS